MAEREAQTPQELLRTFNFQEFRPEKLANLKNWEAIEFVANKRWVFRHKKFDRGKKDYFFEVYKSDYPTIGKENRNRVNLIVTNPNQNSQAQVFDVRYFSVGTVDVGRAEESQAVRFSGLHESSLEIRDSGLYVYKNGNTIIASNPLK